MLAMFIKDIVKIKPFSHVIDFQAEGNIFIDNYIVMNQTASYYRRILEGFSQYRDQDTVSIEGTLNNLQIKRCHKLTGSYGVGKSYFLLMLRSMLQSLNNDKRFMTIHNKFAEFPAVQKQLDFLKQQASRYIVVSINGKSFGELAFRQVIEEQVYDELVRIIGFDQLEFSGFFIEASSLLKDWQKRNNPIFQPFADELKKTKQIEYERLIEALEHREPEARTIYCRTYQKVLSHEAPQARFQTLKQFLDECSQNVKKNGYNGLVVIYDEFSAFLRSRSEAGGLSNDLDSIETLAEATLITSAKDIHFITTEHEDIEAILSKDIENREAAQKAAGRFENYPLFFDKGSELIGGVLEKDAFHFNELLHHHTNSFDMLKKNKPAYNSEEIYPLNPYAAEYLISVSERYAQNDRTVFSFIAKVVSAFLELKPEQNNGLINLINPDLVMEHFKDIILNKRSELTRAYNEEIARCTNDKQKSAIDLLALDYAISVSKQGQGISRIKLDDLKYALILDEQEMLDVKEFLNREKNDLQSHIIFNTAMGSFEITAESSGIDIEAEIDNELIHCNEMRFLDRIIDDRSNTLEVRRSYTILKAARKFPFDRHAQGKYFHDLTRLNITTIINELENLNQDGQILFYIPPAGKPYDYATTRQIVANLSTKLSSSRLFIAIPKKSFFSDFEGKALLNRLEAIEILISNNETIKNHQKAYNELRMAMVDTRTRVYSKLSAFGRAENYAFFMCDAVHENVTNINEFLEWWMLEKLYPKFPRVEAEDFSSRNSSNALIKDLVIPQQMDKVNIEGSSVVEKQIRFSLKPWDLVTTKKVVGGYKVTLNPVPNNNQIKDIFHVLSDLSMDLSTKHVILTASPFGLNDPILELLFAIFLRTAEKYYLQANDGKRYEISTDNINNFWKKALRLCETTDSVSIPIKQDVINILQLIDKALINNHNYERLKATMPSDSFAQSDKSEIIGSYTRTMSEKISGFIKNLETINLSLRDLSMVEKIQLVFANMEQVFKPTDLLLGISHIVDQYFNNGILLDEEVTEIKAERYKLLQNFLDNMIWLEQSYQSIKTINNLVKKLNNAVAGGTVELLDKEVEELNKKKSAFISDLTQDQAWKNSKFNITLDLPGLNAAVQETINEYNEKYLKEHQLLHDKHIELKERLKNYRFIALIEQLERIKFPGLMKITAIQKDITSLLVCSAIPSLEPLLLTNCKSCGYLPMIMDKFAAAEIKWTETIGRIDSLIEKYIDKLEELLDSDKVKSIYDKYDNLLDFMKSQHSDKQASVGNLFALLRDSWRDNAEDITAELRQLVEAINEFIEIPSVVNPPNIRRVKINSLMEQLYQALKNCGYSEMTFPQFRTETNRYLKELEKEFKSIDVT